MSARHERLFIPGPAGRLAAIFQPGRSGRPGVVVCHPHPLHGGTMRNKVVYWIARSFEELGCHVLRFNFRGVDGSEGAWDEGRGEALDAAAAIDWLRKRQGVGELWVAGFSFGCYAGLKAASGDSTVRRLFAVAPAVNLHDFSFLEGDKRPLTIVQGEADEIVPAELVRAWASRLVAASLHRIPGAGHFFDGHMDEMRAALLADLPERYRNT